MVIEEESLDWAIGYFSCRDKCCSCLDSESAKATYIADVSFRVLDCDARIHIHTHKHTHTTQLNVLFLQDEMTSC